MTNGFSKTIAAPQAEVRSRFKHIQGRTFSNPLRGQAPQPDLTPTGTIDAVRAAPTVAPDPSPSNMELDQSARTMLVMITRGRPPPLYHG